MEFGEWPDGKSEFTERLTLEKRLKDYKEFREGLKKSPGIPERVAWRVAGSQFPPTNGDPMEYPPTEETIQWIKHLDLPNPWEGVEIPAEAVEVAVEADDTSAKPAKKVSQTTKKIKLAESFEMLALQVDATRSATELEVIRWAFNNYKTPLDKLDPEGVPSIGAIGLLEHIRTSQANYSEFIRAAWIKLIPSDRQLKYASQFDDDDGGPLDLCDAFDAEFEEAESAA